MKAHSTQHVFMFSCSSAFSCKYFLHLLLLPACASLFNFFSSSILNDCIIWCMHMECTRASAMSSMIFLVFLFLYIFSFYYRSFSFHTLPRLIKCWMNFSATATMIMCERKREAFGYEMKVIVLLFFISFLVCVIKL